MSRRRDSRGKDLPTQAQVEKFDMLLPMIISLLNEMREFSKKKPDGVVNLAKIKMINRLLSEAKVSLGNDPSVAYLDLLDEDALPQNSDVVLIVGQFRAAMEQFKQKYHGYQTFGGTRWSTQEWPGSDVDRDL